MENRMFSLEGKIALITGASYGIGFCNCKRVCRSRCDNCI